MTKLLKKLKEWEGENHSFFLIVVGLVLLWFLTPILIGVIYDAELGDDSAKIGDTFNWYTSLITGLATVMLVYSISLQRKDLAKQSEQLELQRQEMELQRKEMAATARAMQEQVELASMTAQIGNFPTLIKNKEDAIAGNRYLWGYKLHLDTKLNAAVSVKVIAAFSAKVEEGIREEEMGNACKLLLVAEPIELEIASREGVADFRSHEEIEKAVVKVARSLAGYGHARIEESLKFAKEALRFHEAIEGYAGRMRELSER